LLSERRKTAFGRPTVQSIDRSLNVLEALAVRSAPAGISDLAQQVGLHVSTVHRLLSTLVDRGYVRQDPQTSRYHLGSRIFALATAADAHLDLCRVARPYLERMMRSAGQTVKLAAAADPDVIYVDQVEMAPTFQTHAAVGTRAPMYCTGSGKAILAHRERPALDAVLSGPFESYTRQTLITRQAIEAELAKIRRIGYAVDNEEREMGVRCLAVAVFDHRSDVVGAVSVCAPAARVTLEHLERMGPFVRSIAQELSEELGYRSATP
jgi:DNA-binding IclR family transcriptional regulator